MWRVSWRRWIEDFVRVGKWMCIDGDVKCGLHIWAGVRR